MTTNLVKSKEICKLSLKVCESIDSKNPYHLCFKELLLKHDLFLFHKVLNSILYHFSDETICLKTSKSTHFLWLAKNNFLELYLKVIGGSNEKKTIYDLINKFCKNDESMECFYSVRETTKVLLKIEIGYSNEDYVDLLYDLMDFYLQCISIEKGWKLEDAR